MEKVENELIASSNLGKLISILRWPMIVTLKKEYAQCNIAYTSPTVLEGTLIYTKNVI